MTEIKYGVGVLPTPDKGAFSRGFPEALLSYLQGLSPRFESLIVPDHISSLTGSSEGYYILEGMTLVTYLSAMFPRFKFETMVLCNSYRNPALLAKMSATINDLTNGRFTLGIGAGWVESEDYGELC